MTGDPPQDRLDPKDHLTGTERLGHVVVGAELEPADPVLGLGLRGEQQDRQPGRGADLAYDLLTRNVGQSEVEDDQVDAAGGGEGQPLRTSGGREHCHASAFR